MRKLCLVVMALAAFRGAAPAGDPPEVVVAGPLSPAEGLTLAGRVEGGTAPVLVQVWRYAFDVNGRWSHDIDTAEAQTALVPPGGRFRFTGLAPGRYECDFGDQRLHWTRPDRTVDVYRDVEDQVLVVPSNCRLKGRVTRAFADRKSRATVALGCWGVDVAEDGTFETPDVLPGAYRAVIRESWLEEAGPGRFDSIERSIPVELAGGVMPLDVTLTPDVPLAVSIASSRGGESFVGRFGATSALVDWESGWFRVVGGNASEPQIQRTRPSFPHGAAVWAAPDRVLRLEGLCAGSHRLRLTALGFEPWERDVDVGPRVRVEAEMTALAGQFVEVANLPDVARVEVRSQRGPWREIAAQDRRLVSMGADYEPSVVEFLAPGRHEWRGESLEGVPTRAAELDVTAERTTVQLAPSFASGRVLHGRLRSKSGRALGGVRMRVALREDEAWRLVPAKDTRTEERTGAFEIRGLSAGHWRAQLDDAGDVVLGEFDVGDADVTKDFVFRAR